MNFSRADQGEEGLALLAAIKARASDAARGPDHRVGLDLIWRCAGSRPAPPISSPSPGPTSSPADRAHRAGAVGAGRRRPASPARARSRRRVRLRRPGRRAIRRLCRSSQVVGRVAPTRRVGADHRRERHRQGAGRRRHPPQQPARGRPVREGQLRRRSRRRCSRASCSGTCAAPSPSARTIARAASSWRDGGTLFLDEIGELPTRRRR